MKLTAEKAWLDLALPRRALMYFAISRLCFVAAALILFLAGLAYAQEAGAAPPVPLFDDPEKLLALLFSSIESGNWWLLAGTALMLVVFALRTWGPKLFPKFGTFLLNPVVSVVLPLVLSVLTGLVEALVLGKPITVGVLLASLKPGMAAIVQFVTIKKAVEAAKAHGAKAAADPGPTLGA